MQENAGIPVNVIQPLTHRVTPQIALVVILGGNILLWGATIAGAVWLFRP
jgi:hypothetical protein